MEKNLEIMEVEEAEVQKESKVKTFLVTHKKKVFTGLGLIGAFVLGAIAQSKWSDDDDCDDHDDEDESVCDCDDCACGHDDDSNE